jgi:hypothetical protein
MDELAQTARMNASRVTPLKSAILSAIGALIVPTASTFAQPPAAVAPPAAYSVGAAYDAARQQLVLFGGYRDGQYVGDTWEWDGRIWRRTAESGPTPRNGPALAYDEARHQIVLFGGDTRATGALGDTWVFDGGGWRRVATSGPPPRSTHHIVYDARRRRIVLFGGAAGTTMLGDTWEWDGERWTLMASDGPPARTLYGLAYDSARGRVVLFGGTSVLAPDAPSFGDTWEWDGAHWTQIKTTGPSARDHVAMGYDPLRRVVVLHGGGTGPVDPAETWTYDGRSWTRASSTGPRRRFAKLVFDAHAGAMLLCGGFDTEPSAELWRLTGATWERVAP